MNRACIFSLGVLCFSAREVCSQTPAPAQKPAQPEFKFPASIVLEANIEYRRAGDRRLKLDLLRPKNQGDKVLPAVVDVHGGGWRSKPFLPLKNVTADYPPTLLIYGTVDPDVPYEQSVLTNAELEKHHVEHKLIEVNRADHGFAGADAKTFGEINRAIMNFVQEYAPVR